MRLCVFSAPDKEFYEFINSQKQTFEILDFSNRIDSGKTHNKVIPFNSLPIFYALQKHAIEDYLRFCRELSRIDLDSKTSIRDITILGLPVYWISLISEKHPRYHWGLSFFCMLTYLKEATDKASTIYLPNALSGLAKTLSAFGKQNDLVFDYLINKKEAESLRIKRFVELIRSYFALMTWQRPKAFAKEDAASINLIIHTGGDLAFKREFESLANKLNVPLKIFPANLPLDQKSQKSFLISKAFWKSRPGLIGLCKIFASSFRAYGQVKSVEDKELNVSGLVIPSSVIKNEMTYSIHSSLDKIILYQWYTNYFEKQLGTFFLDDEFYIIGRLVIQAKRLVKNNKITIKGVQHGMFSETHTVYNISSEEVDGLKCKEDGLPVPDKFIVWGNHFKQLFLSTGAFDESYVSVNGALKYLYTPVTTNSIKKDLLLWCLTTGEHFRYELSFVKEMLSAQPKLKVLIRRHPRVPIAINDITDLMRSYQIDFEFDTNQSVLESIRSSSLVVTTSHSTIFLDSAILKVPVIRIVHDRKDSDTSISMPYVFVANVVADIQPIMDEIRDYKGEDSKENFLYTLPDRWERELVTR